MDKIQELAQALTDKSAKMVKVGKWMVDKEVYDLIVTEQKAIDDEYWTDRLNAYAKEARELQESLIDKACRCYCKMCGYHNLCKERGNFNCGAVKGLREEMEK